MDDAMIEPLGRMLIVLLALLLTPWGLNQCLKRRTGAPTGGQLRIVTAVAVGHRERFVLIELEGERLLVGVTPQGITPLWRPHPFGEALASRHRVPEESIPSTTKEPNDAAVS
jgi:flagellar biogenesis protein FliO